MNEIIQRFSSPTPGFFKKLRNSAIAVVSVASCLVLLPVSLPVAVLSVCKVVLAVGTATGLTSQLTVKNPL